MVCCFFGLEGGESKARTRMGRKNETQKRFVRSYPLGIQTPKLVRPEKALALPEHISRAASRITGLVRKFEEYKELKKRLQNLVQSLVQVHSSYGSLANILGTAMDLHPKPCGGFFPRGDLHKQFQTRNHSLSQPLLKAGQYSLTPV